MPTRARFIVAVLFAVALTVASCSSATDGQQVTAQSPSATRRCSPWPETSSATGPARTERPRRRRSWDRPRATKLGPAQGGAVWLDVALDTSAFLPTDLVHAVSFTVPKPTPPLINAVMDEKVAPVVALSRKPVVSAPPLDGPGWLDGNGCCDMSAHRNAG